jgi:hypothetical protein
MEFYVIFAERCNYSLFTWLRGMDLSIEKVGGLYGHLRYLRHWRYHFNVQGLCMEVIAKAKARHKVNQ